MATSTKVKHVVADTGAFIRNAPLRDIGEQIYSLPEVIGEIKDKATKQRLQFLPYKLEYREPSAESVALVTEFSKKTGDYPSLSAVDIRVLALAYQLEKEHVGTKHIKTSPDTKTEINLSTPAPSQPAQIAGFYLGTQSEEQSGSISESIDEVTATLEKQTVTDVPSDVHHSSPSPSEVSPQQTSVAANDGTHSETTLKETDKNVWPALSRVPLTNSTLKTASEKASVQQIYSEIRDDSTSGCPVNNLNDEEEFPTLSHDTREDITSILIDSQETSVVPNVYVEVRDKSGEDNLLLVDNDEYPSLSTQGDSLSEKSITAGTNTVSYAKIIQDGQAKVQLKPAAVRVFKEGQVLPSSLIQEEGGEEGEESEEEEEEDSDGEEEEDGEGWITPSNIQKVKKQMGGGDTERADVTVGCLTTDFAMQNVLIQMGLNVVSVDGMLIKKAKSYVLRCFACFKITSKMEKLFCPHCGNHTLKRIAMTVHDDGTIKYFFSRRKKLSSRGLKYSLPTPKGGKHASNPILVADQPFPHQRPTKKSLKSMDVFDPDFMASESPFCRNDVTSRAAQLGIMRQGQNGRRRHQIGVKKSTGRRK